MTAGTIRKPAQSISTGRYGSSHMSLMQAIGAASYNPMPPAQHAFLMSEENRDVDRYVAWVWENTINLGHPSAGFEQRSPYCVDQNGKTLKVEDAAARFEWDPGYARKIQRQARAQGRVRVDKQRRIWLCGQVTPTEVEPDEDEPETSPIQSEQKANKKDCTRYVIPAILLKIRERPAQEREKILAEESRAADLFDRAAAEAIAQLRAIRDQRQDTRFRAWGLPERRKKLVKVSKVEEPKPEPIVKITYLELEETANKKDCTGPPPDTSTSEAKRTVQVSKTHLVRSSPPYMYTERDTETTTTAGSPPLNEVVVVVSKIQEYGGSIGNPAAKKFLAACRAESPGCSIEEIQTAIDEIGSTLHNVRNPTGVFLTSVPPLIPAQKQKWAAKTAERDADQKRAAAAAERGRLEIMETCRRTLASDASETDKAMARETLAELEQGGRPC